MRKPVDVTWNETRRNRQQNRHWRAFAGCSLEEMAAHLKAQLELMPTPWRQRRHVLTQLQALMLGGGREAIELIVGEQGDWACTLRILPAVADPFTRTAFLWFGGADSRKRLTGVCVLHIECAPNARGLVKSIVSGANERAPHGFATFNHHAVFRVSPLLVFRMRRQWRHVLADGP